MIDQCASASVLPIARDAKNNLYFLLGREGSRFDHFGREWGDFGGKRNEREDIPLPHDDQNNIAMTIAQRECFEESCGLLDVRKMIRDDRLVAQFKLFDSRKKACLRHNIWCPHFARPDRQTLPSSQAPNNDQQTDNAVPHALSREHPVVPTTCCDCSLPSFHGSFVVEVPFDLSMPLRFDSLRCGLSRISKECVETKRLERLVCDDQQARSSRATTTCRSTPPLFQHLCRIGRKTGRVSEISNVDRHARSIVVHVMIRVRTNKMVGVQGPDRLISGRVLVADTTQEEQNRYCEYVQQLSKTLLLMVNADPVILNSPCVDASRDLFYIDPIFLEKTIVRWWSLKEVIAVLCRKSQVRFRPALCHLIRELLCRLSVPSSTMMAPSLDIPQSSQLNMQPLDGSMLTLEGEESKTLAERAHSASNHSLSGVLWCKNGILQFCNKSTISLIH